MNQKNQYLIKDWLIKVTGRCENYKFKKNKF